MKHLIAAHQRGVQVKIILDKNKTQFNSIEPDIKNQAAYALLKAAGVDVAYDSLDTTTHSKCIVIDQRYVICGSTNWTYSAIKRNNEISLLIDSPELAKAMEIKISGIR